MLGLYLFRARPKVVCWINRNISQPLLAHSKPSFQAVTTPTTTSFQVAGVYSLAKYFGHLDYLNYYFIYYFVIRGPFAGRKPWLFVRYFLICGTKGRHVPRGIVWPTPENLSSKPFIVNHFLKYLTYLETSCSG